MSEGRQAGLTHARAAFYEADTFDEFLAMIKTRNLGLYAFRPPGATISRGRFEKNIDKARELFGDSAAIEWIEDQMRYKNGPKGAGR